MFTRLENKMRKRRKTLSGRRVTFNIPSKFESVLNQPFEKWNELEHIVEAFLPDWTFTQRSVIIQNLVRFLELKIMMEDYDSKSLLSATFLVAQAWQALVLETKLYKQVTYAIQNFHGRPHKLIHHSLMKQADVGFYEDRLRRTQSLFKCYYDEIMPKSLGDIDIDNSLADASALTEMNGQWPLPIIAGCSDQLHEESFPALPSEDGGEGDQYQHQKRSKQNQNNQANSTVTSPPQPSTSSYPAAAAAELLSARCMCFRIMSETFFGEEDIDGDESIYDDDVSIVTPEKTSEAAAVKLHALGDDDDEEEVEEGDDVVQPAPPPPALE